MGDYRIGYTAYHKQYYKANKEKIEARRRELYSTSEENRLMRIAGTVNTPNRAAVQKAAYIKRAYGMTVVDFESLMDSQNQQCAICGHSDQSKPKMFPLIDHDHNTSMVRGILCNDCNLGLARFKDNSGLLRKAIEYLEKSRGAMDRVVPDKLRTRRAA
jgi:Recombination endonuclease VII